MRAINHALTGAVIGLVVGNPVVALPAAVISHYICDAVPHFGVSSPSHSYLRKKSFTDYLILDTILCFILVLVLFLYQPQNYLLASVCAFLATAPDLFWINQYLQAKKGKSWQPGAYSRFAKTIQWFERPIGGIVEIAWLIAGTLIILPLL
ncbi:MAG: hypothetical protein NVS1B10_01740 [Candidatus Saccharimonadales bacterium]